MNITPQIREKVAQAIWDAGEGGGDIKWADMDPKRDKGLKREIYLMADAALQVIAREIGA